MVNAQDGAALFVAIVIVFVVSYGLYAFVNESNNFIETEYEVSAIDLQTLVYINNNGEIVTIDWSDKTSQIDIINSNTTYIVTETTKQFTFHTLYLNVSDLGW